MKPFIRTGLTWSLVATILAGGIAAYAWSALPTAGDIPVHWNIHGEPDQFAPRGQAGVYLLILPGAMALISLVLAVAPLIDPRGRNVEAGRRAYLAAWLGAMLLLLMLQGGITALMLKAGGDTSLPDGAVRWVIAAASALFVLIGNYMPKTRSSFVFGIRTPWTLSSDTAWEKTHRMAGPLFMVAGALGIAGAFLFSGIWLALQLTGLIMAAALISVVYSYFAWRSAADRDDGTGLTV